MIRYIFLLTSAIVIGVLVLLVFLLPTEKAVLAEQNQSDNTNNLLITNVTVFDGEKTTDNQTIELQAGKIVSVEAYSQSTAKKQGIKIVDGTNLTVLPGLIDAHTHTYGNGLQDSLRFGVSAHLDMFGAEDNLLNTRQARESISVTNKSDLFSAGTLATVPNGHGTQYGFAIDTIDSFEEIASWVSLRKQAGADYIKLVYMPYQDYMPSLNRTLAQEIINQGHLQGMKVLAHISTYAAAKDMVEDDIDGLVHIFADKLASKELINMVKNKGVFIIPTLAVIASADGQGLSQAVMENSNVDPYLTSQQRSTLGTGFGIDIPGFEFEIAKQNVALFHAAGVPILSGSDAPNPGTAYGISALHETVLLVEAGLTPLQALAAATSQPAKLFGLDNRGKINVGARADIVLVEGNLRKDINALYNIRSVYKNGFEIKRGQDVPSTSGARISNTVLGSFDIAAENNLATIDSFMWSLTDDSMANGPSKATIEVVSSGNDNNGVLKVNAAVNAGFRYPWAGAAVGDFAPPVEGLDVSAYTKLVFEVRGDTGTYRVLSFDSTTSGIPPSQNFVIDSEWRTVSLSLSEFAGLNTKVLSGFAFVAGPAVGDFEFYLDNIRIE